MQRAELRVTGIVQGVGFRPFCVRTAKALGLRGTVRNTSGGVEILAEGARDVIDEFVRAIWEDHPDAAVVTAVEDRRFFLSAPSGPSFADFSVVKSSATSSSTDGPEENKALIPADLAVCEDCLAEMRDPSNRRYRYPFINCTNCGPRYTIIRGLPYDRPETTMDAFEMCPDCLREYEDPSDRRYHAQPNACPKCGPQIRLTDSAGRVLCHGEAALGRLITEIAAGRLAAVKGIGGFHIACLPEDGPVLALRRRKRRPDKPFALMVRDVEAAGRLADVSPEAERLLRGVQRPIVLCPVKEAAETKISPLVAPGQKRLGIMLPYAPLHYLIMEKFDALVMTSANISDAPIISSDEEAFASLGGVADFFLCHGREIHTAIDDSVLLPPVEKGLPPVFLRRARGYVPNPISIANFLSRLRETPNKWDSQGAAPLERGVGRSPAGFPNILAAGAQMKATYTLTRGDVLFPGQYLGDLDQLGTAAYYKNSLERFIRLYRIKPEIFAFDKHPGYAATELAREIVFAEAAPVLCPVQHHHAHLASALLDNNYFEPVIGAIFDGTGYGDDGAIWGGEFLAGDARGFRRMGSLLPFPLPGGERAIREPWRCGLALINEAFGTADAAKTLWPELADKAGPVAATLKSAPITTSCGRLFDGVSAILNLCTAASYDGQAAMLLENAAAPGAAVRGLDFGLIENEDGFVHLDWRGAVRSLARCSEFSTAAAAWAFHAGLAAGVADVCGLLRERTGINHAVLSGGVWQNALLLKMALEELRRRGFVTLTHRAISPNDEGVSVGQAVAAAALIGRS